MQIFLVGGFIRDTLLKRIDPTIQPGDKDWVVVGSTPQEMISLGYQPVGENFPVFLHPQTHEEYALARTERKNGLGYHGFTFYCTPETTLQEDLSRRDLTINAIAMDASGNFIDPFGGICDIQKKVLRHIGKAFQEDPVRLLRIARFQARFPTFHIAPETWDLMHIMSKLPDIHTLTPERIRKELLKALSYEHPELFFQTLHAVALIQPILAPIIWGSQEQNFLQKITSKFHDPSIRLVALTCHLTSTRDIKKLERKICLNRFEKRLCVSFLQYKILLQNQGLTASVLEKILQSIDAIRRPERATIILELLRLFFSIHLDIHTLLSNWKNIDIQTIVQQYQHEPKIISSMIFRARKKQTQSLIQAIVSRETLTIT